MKIVGLKIDGIRKLTAVEMEFDKNKGGLIPIKGKNKQGKTSILDSLELMFKGIRKKTSDMITHGKDQAKIEVELDEGYVIKRILKDGYDTIEIRKDGRVWKDMSPQKFLDTLTNDLTFNPRPFLDKKPEEKLKFLMDLLKIDFTKIDKEIQDLEGERLLIGREIKAFGEIEAVEAIQEISIPDLLEEKKIITERNNQKLKDAEERVKKIQNEVTTFNTHQDTKQKEIDRYNAILAQLNVDKTRINSEIEDLEARLAVKKIELEGVNERIANGIVKIQQLPQPEPKKEMPNISESVELENTEEIDNKIAMASETNKLAMKYHEYLVRSKQKSEKELMYSTLSDKIEKKRFEKHEILAATPMPVKGLEIKELLDKPDVYGLFFNDIFCENWSDSEGITISSTLCLAMKPQLSAVFIDRGESYDEDGLNALAKWSEENSIQTFVTIVDSIPEELEPGVFYVKEGNVVNIEE